MAFEKIEKKEGSARLRRPAGLTVLKSRGSAYLNTLLVREFKNKKELYGEIFVDAETKQILIKAYDLSEAPEKLVASFANDHFKIYTDKKNNNGGHISCKFPETIPTGAYVLQSVEMPVRESYTDPARVLTLSYVQ